MKRPCRVQSHLTGCTSSPLCCRGVGTHPVVHPSCKPGLTGGSTMLSTSSTNHKSPEAQVLQKQGCWTSLKHCPVILTMACSSPGLAIHPLLSQAHSMHRATEKNAEPKHLYSIHIGYRDKGQFWLEDWNTQRMEALWNHLNDTEQQPWQPSYRDPS